MTNRTPIPSMTGRIPVTGWRHVDRIWTLGDYGHKLMLKDYPDVAVRFEPMVRQAEVIGLERALRDLLRAFDHAMSSRPERNLGAAPALAGAKRALGLNPYAFFNDTLAVGGIPVTGWLHEDKIWSLGNYGHQVMLKDCPASAAKYEPMVRQAAVAELERAMHQMLLAFDPLEGHGLQQSASSLAAVAAAKQALGLNPRAVVCHSKAVAH